MLEKTKGGFRRRCNGTTAGAETARVAVEKDAGVRRKGRTSLHDAD
jgi:hypothetical protein